MLETLNSCYEDTLEEKLKKIADKIIKKYKDNNLLTIVPNDEEKLSLEEVYSILTYENPESAADETVVDHFMCREDAVINKLTLEIINEYKKTFKNKIKHSDVERYVRLNTLIIKPFREMYNKTYSLEELIKIFQKGNKK
jgi:hypothetical protein